jgi:hypothetical protein
MPDTPLAGVIGSQRSLLRVALLRYCAIETTSMLRLMCRLRDLAQNTRRPQPVRTTHPFRAGRRADLSLSITWQIN